MSADEGSDGAVYRFLGVKPDQLLKIIFIEKRNLQLGKGRIEARLKFLDYLNGHGAPVLQLIPSLKGSF